MNNNKLNEKKEIAKGVLKDRKADLWNWKEDLREVEKQYIGEKLKEEKEKYTRWANTDQVIIEALEGYILNIDTYLGESESEGERSRTPIPASEEIMNMPPDVPTGFSGERQN